MAEIAAAIALTRFGLGARPEEWAKISGDPKAYLRATIGNGEAALIRGAGLPSAVDAFRAQTEYREARREAKTAEPLPVLPIQATGIRDVPPERALAFARKGADLLGSEVIARTRAGVDTPFPFAERWALFWANHFTVGAVKAASLGLAGPFEREAIRPRIWGKFAAMLRAASTHQGMLAYLDQAGSIGPNSAFGQRRERGLNENLAREILELHTLGVAGGFSQADVTEFARALTGWIIVAPRVVAGLERLGITATLGETLFLEAAHEPGTRVILGKTYPQAGAAQSLAVLDDLARHPATARFIAEKLARHFSADTPPEALVARLERSFRATDGDLAALARTLIDSPEAWAPAQLKFKQPYEFLISSLRAAGSAGALLQLPELRRAFELLGQPPLRAASPKGWPDEAAAWAGPDAVLKRVEYSQFLANRVADGTAPMVFLEQALGPLAPAKLRQAVAQAQSASQAIALVLMSPEFQRR